MKSVLISIQPKWCELIASGKKTVEVRKTRPKIETPFKCYIYQTKMRWVYSLLHALGFYSIARRLARGTGKVIGEFVCDDIFTDKTFGHYGIFKTAACMSDADISAYCLNKEIYCWHISNLVIYDKPKELVEFNHCGRNYHFNPPITRPPQSWCYVEHPTEKGAIQNDR